RARHRARRADRQSRRRMNEELRGAREVLQAHLAELLKAEVPDLDQALTHRSYANEVGVADNQRLEFLGDAVLGLCVSELLIAAHPAADEGRLSRMRSALVNAAARARERSATRRTCSPTRWRLWWPPSMWRAGSRARARSWWTSWAKGWRTR